MSVIFFAISPTGTPTPDLEAFELQVSNLNAIRIQKAVGVDYDPADQPGGEMTLDDFLKALVHGYKAAGDQADMRNYLNQLNSLWGAAVDAGADVIAWG